VTSSAENMPPKPSKMGVNRQFLAITAKYKNYNISETMNPIKTKFEDKLQTNNCNFVGGIMLSRSNPI